MRARTTTQVRLLLSVILAVVLLLVIEGLSYLPHLSQLAEILGFPGLIIAWVFYREGIHTGSGTANWVVLLYLGNLGFYTALWYLVLWLLKFPRTKPTG